MVAGVSGCVIEVVAGVSSCNSEAVVGVIGSGSGYLGDITTSCASPLYVDL